MANSDGDFQQSSWTQYQKLVLAELERHDQRQSDLEKDIVELKLTQAGIIKDIAGFVVGLKDLSESLKDSVKEIKTAKDTMNDQKLDIKQLQWRMGLWSGGVSSVVAIAVEVGLRIFFH